MPRPAKRATSADVARAAGVSRATVSYVLNNRPDQSIPDTTRRRVLEAAESLEYRPHGNARSLVSGRSDIVLLSVPDLPIGTGISRFVEEFAAALAEHGLTLVTHLAAARGRPLPDVCATVGATAVTGFAPFDADTARALRAAGAEVVLPSPTDVPDIMLPIGSIQAEHLIGRGHQRLGYALPAHPRFQQMAAERLRGVEQACVETGLQPPVTATVSLDVGVAADAVTNWIGQGVTGICAFNDETAVAVLAGAQSRAVRVPEELAVIGVDDILVAPLTNPPLTTVRFDLHAVARRRAELVVAGLTGHDAPAATESEISAGLVERSST
ncbi:LacI family DNA-binding transcriptional regulator [Actinoplanes couchii]|uniref:LacI family transcriptional regulator n=1 Tax=Actinoplanes couchii TaxID=403638 RepID=A0ABQ3X8G3_9ACTN|nr:LacI family DNA-binding transcriptional regulator [Actinoplanes couchii]MDR6320199.1 DNA-binding LacI/PurR family transcriptional regulator [Actinoplanes couchii]GID54787.1 LacI family transcriptional regulator [Actinoplanes couchii]